MAILERHLVPTKTRAASGEGKTFILEHLSIVTHRDDGRGVKFGRRRGDEPRFHRAF